MILCAECKSKGVFMEPSGNPGEFCSNQCRKAAVEHGKVQGCAMCHIYPRVRLQNGSRSNYCGRQCQSRAQVPRPPTTQSNIPNITSPTRPTPPIPVSGGIWVPVKVPLCLYCQNKPCWKDPGTQTYLSFCGRRCKETFDAVNTLSPNNGIVVPNNGIVVPNNGIIMPNNGMVVPPSLPRPTNTLSPQLLSPPLPPLPSLPQPTNKSPPRLLSTPINGTRQQETPPSDPQLDLNQPPGLDKLNETKPNKNKRTSTLQSIDTITLSDDSELPPPYEPSDRDRFKNCSDRKITRDDSFDDENPYGTFS
ncbi:hypothetical protein Glove_48g205 [Diversispora epigaea]|uniref:Uncharacterized protein n=1 Tax=Diversispora epigaea TaxID=1348612 RepID=A0A397JE70_9GLOM|nr:hypothetical protein Glove_48g205 [Diversispora epigaea]